MEMVLSAEEGILLMVKFTLSDGMKHCFCFYSIKVRWSHDIETSQLNKIKYVIKIENPVKYLRWSVLRK